MSQSIFNDSVARIIRGSNLADLPAIRDDLKTLVQEQSGRGGVRGEKVEVPGTFLSDARPSAENGWGARESEGQVLELKVNRKLEALKSALSDLKLDDPFSREPGVGITTMLWNWMFTEDVKKLRAHLLDLHNNPSTLDQEKAGEVLSQLRNFVDAPMINNTGTGVEYWLRDL